MKTKKHIKQFILIILTPIFFLETAQATFCVDRVFKEENITLYLCQNHTNYHETRSLLFKARTKVLSSYIETQISNGKLTNKRFEIQIYDQILTYQHLEISQSKNGYFISLSGFPSLHKLLSIIDYFAQPDWKPFFTGDYQKMSFKAINQQITSFYQQNTPSSIPPYPPFTIWAKDEVRLEYANDSLTYFINNHPLPISATATLPVPIKDRYLFFQSNYIFVVQDQQIINTYPVKSPISEDYYIYTYEKWVNISHGRKENWLFSYSYDKNTFYTPTKKETVK